jgi:hypothetical protein
LTARNPIPEKAVSSVADRINGQVTSLCVMSHPRKWHFRLFNRERLLSGLVQCEQDALELGYAGLRLNGNCAWVSQDQWADLLKYEKLLQETLRGRRVVCMCSYCVNQLLDGSQLGVMPCHDSTVPSALGLARKRWAPTQKGFSSPLLEQLISRDLDGDTKLIYDGSGLRCTSLPRCDCAVSAIAPKLELLLDSASARTELTRLALAILRDTGEPLLIAAGAGVAARGRRMSHATERSWSRKGGCAPAALSEPCSCRRDPPPSGCADAARSCAVDTIKVGRIAPFVPFHASRTILAAYPLRSARHCSPNRRTVW